MPAQGRSMVTEREVPTSRISSFTYRKIMKRLSITILLLVAYINLFAQFNLSGTIADEQGNFLPGASVKIQNTQFGAGTDSNGSFTIKNIPAGEYIILVSFVGFENYINSIEIESDKNISIKLKESIIWGDEVIVFATRANEKTPTTFTNVSADEIKERNLGQDIPILLNLTPSIVTTSDAGAGVGYTGMRIRGSDATRINVTINGIPVNDSESHGVFWVNMPDLASSLNQIQVQRGVGTSSNGAAAFGATINMQTSTPKKNPFGEIALSAGSFNTWKANVIFNTGLINDKFNFEGRLSQISSDGYIDRASSDLKSYFLSGGYLGDKTTLKLIAFGGHERTYQAWYGTPQARLENDEEGLQEVIAWSGEYNTPKQIDNLLNSDRRFNYYLYDNEIDNYKQDHYQLHFTHNFNESLNLNISGHYTYGRGYFEQERLDDAFSDYGLENVMIGDSVITNTDLIRRRWLDNDFYGFTYALNFNKNKLGLTFGGSYNKYEGEHYGEIIWSKLSVNSNIRDRYYEGIGIKNDFNSYLKANYQLSENVNLFGDLQIRAIDYNTNGVDNDLVNYDTGGDYLFVNPKFGISYQISPNNLLYASYAIGNREPVRSDFIDAPGGQTPKHETLRNLEAGIKKLGNKLSYEANIYYMGYNNQLVLTGALNDVGASIRTNVPDSYRMGIELSANYQLTKNVNWMFNAALSRNKIENFTEIIYDYAYDDDRFIVENQYNETDIAFSPNTILGSNLSYSKNGFAAQFLSKFVGKQYLDNTSNEDRIINSYFVNDLNLSYNFSAWEMKSIELSLLINNIFNLEYESNGYTWGYMWEGWLYQQNNYYPQAGINFIAGVRLRF
jgi:iron complex outermembrane receptor protein